MLNVLLSRWEGWGEGCVLRPLFVKCAKTFIKSVFLGLDPLDRCRNEVNRTRRISASGLRA